jgi:hypothetical protein
MGKVGLFAIGVAVAALNYKGEVSFGWPEVIALSVWFFLFWLLVRKRGDANGDASPHERERQSFAFRLGQSLNRIRRGDSRRA